MGLLQKALETYDAMEHRAGDYVADSEPLAPIGHMIAKAQIEVTIDADGRFVEARAVKDQKIIIPVTEQSAGRTSGLAAHALCDKLEYVSGDHAEKYKLYINGLRNWAQSEYSHPKVVAVLKYVEGRTLCQDLKNVKISNKKEDEGVVCWRVIGLGENSGRVWADKALMNAYTAYYLSQKQGDTRLCMLTGEDTFAASQHLKGVFSLKGNAKIISTNDGKNFTYRGRFFEPEEAITVGYIASQKAHNALRWIVSNQGTIVGGRAFVCWNPQGRCVLKPTLPMLSQNRDKAAPMPHKEYREALRKSIAGYRESWTPSAQVVIAAFDAVTAKSGRLAVTYYNQLRGSDFLERLAAWDESCCWNDRYYGVCSPPLYDIIAYAFGTPRGKDGKVEPDEKIIASQMQRLLFCRIDQAAFPLDMMQAIVARAERMGNYQNQPPSRRADRSVGMQNDGPNPRNTLLFTACAVIRKYYIDHHKEVFDLALEPTRRDRSYQWGRILAIMEKIERDTYDKGENRESNAIRMQAMFVRRPAYAFKIVMEQLKTAYYPHLSTGVRFYYEKLIEDIMEQLAQDVDDYAKPLGETYLLGYYLQKNALYTKKNDSETEDNGDET